MLVFEAAKVGIFFEIKKEFKGFLKVGYKMYIINTI